MAADRVFQFHGASRISELEGKRLASFQRRAFAFIIDLIICWLLLILVMALLGLILWFRNTGGELSTSYSFRFEQGSWYGKLIIRILVPVLYFGMLTFLMKGKTIGKKLMRIRVVSLATDRISFRKAIERALGYGASIIELGFGFLQYFHHPNCMTAQDCLAETIVVHDGP
jgi:uncharacterized RDD family membrane protein YckC